VVAVIRALAVSAASCSGMDRFQRPYLFASIGCALIGIPFFITKAAIFRYHGLWWWPVTMLIMSLLFSLAHVVCSMRVVDLARRRYSQGIIGFNIQAWEEGEDSWLNANLAGRPSPLADSERSWQHAWKGDVSPEALADSDSRFIKIEDVTLHYKVEEPEVGSGNRNIGIVLVHGFGGGVFSWRHIMAPLARETGCRVVAFDRPAFGLTSRPGKISKDWNPYSSKFQASLLLQLCAALKLSEVVAVGHADGALLALLSAAASCRAHGELPELLGNASPQWAAGSSLHPASPEDPASDMGAAANGMHRSESLSSESSCLSSLRACGGSRPGSSTALSLSTPTLRPSRSADHAGSSAPAAAAEDLEAGGGGHGRRDSRDHERDCDTDSLCDTPSVGAFELSSHGVRVMALAMLHPSLEGEVKPQFMRLLSNSRIGRRIMRPLLRTEIGEIANRRAWYDADKLTKDVLDLYKRPLCVQGWDSALMRVSKLKHGLSPVELLHLFTDIAELPVVVVSGAHDHVIPPRKAQTIHDQLPRSSFCVLPSCGHMPHEECPPDLLPLLQTLVQDACRSLPRLPEEDGEGAPSPFRTGFSASDPML